jgi:hypothetical protein
VVCWSLSFAIAFVAVRAYFTGAGVAFGAIDLRDAVHGAIVPDAPSNPVACGMRGEVV